MPHPPPPCPPSGRRAWLCAAAGAWLPGAWAQPRAAGRPPEADVKGAYLFKFGEFVEWTRAAPAAPDAPFRIGVMGAPGVAEVLEELSRRHSLKGRPVRVLRLRRDEPVPPLQILALDADHAPLLPLLQAQLVQGCVLSVTDGADAGAGGAIVNFVMHEGRVRFAINAAAADEAGLKISSRLLSLAVSVYRGM